MASPLVSAPIYQHPIRGDVWSLHVWNSSLFLGLRNGSIYQWSTPGEVEKTLQGHTDIVTSLIDWKDVLWSGSKDETIRAWNLHTGRCFKVLHAQYEVRGLVIWKNMMVSGGSSLIIGFISVWNREGNPVFKKNVADEGGKSKDSSSTNFIICFVPSSSARSFQYFRKWHLRLECVERLALFWSQQINYFMETL